MNLFALAFIFAPIAGAISGVDSVKSHGAAWTAAGALIGLAVGIAVFFAGIGLFGLRGTQEKPNFLRGTAAAVGFCWLVLSPLVAWTFSHALVTWLVH
jgi:hypothetical protein